MYDLHDNPNLSKKVLIRIGKNNPAALLRLCKYLRISFSSDSIEEIARFTAFLLKNKVINYE